ncbi:hypothetical protein [uncultured Dialister sp.]|uniref:hypothetical protein n=1 Tax=uncultured Dialister sp. TaxID=278064 RepID=UPI00258C9E35|nr:hypothetical protein [uncultured Dialister sp.]
MSVISAIPFRRILRYRLESASQYLLDVNRIGEFTDTVQGRRPAADRLSALRRKDSGFIGHLH